MRTIVVTAPGVLERFERKVRKSKKCWVWTGALVRGYGQFWLDGCMQYAHRVAYELYVGPRDGLQVLHRCDNPACVNPGHLFLGTPATNARDRDEKGRRTPPAGEAHGCAKLNQNAVREIRQLRSTGRTYKSLGEEFGCSESNIYRICKGKNWKEAPCVQ